MMLPPSKKRQPWALINSAAGITFAASYGAIQYHTFNQLTDWQSLGMSWNVYTYTMDMPLASEIVAALESTKNNIAEHWKQLGDLKLKTRFILHSVLPALVSTIPAFLVGRYFHVPGGIDGLSHISGPKLYYFRAAKKHARKMLKRELKNKHKRGLSLSPTTGPTTLLNEQNNVIVVGAQGSGKTVILRYLLQQIVDRGSRVFIYDEKREYTKYFYQEELTILIAPWDQRSASNVSNQWDIQADASTDELAELIADTMIPPTEDPIWSEGARKILAACIVILNRKYQKWGWVELKKILSIEEDKLFKLVGHFYPQAVRLLREKSKTTDSFFAKLMSHLGWVYTLAKAWPEAYNGGFSVSKWIHDDDAKPQVIVQSHSKFKNLGEPLTSTLVALMTTEVIAQEDSFQREIFLHIDELGNLNNPTIYTYLLRWLSLARSTGARFNGGIQSLNMLYSNMPKREDAESLLNMTLNVIALRCGGAGNSAEQTAAIFGKRQVERPSHSTDANGNRITSWTAAEQPLVYREDLTQLTTSSLFGIHGFLQIPGYDAVYRLRWKLPKTKTIAKEFEPAEWLTQRAPVIDKPQKATSKREQLRSRRIS